MRRSISVFALVAVLTLPLAPAAFAQNSSAGAYLAARQAVLEGDHQAAASFFDDVIGSDALDPQLVGNAILANAAMGQWERALEIARDVTDASSIPDLVNLVVQVDRIRRGDMSEALLAAEEQRGAGPLVDELSTGWLHLAEGNMSRATDAFLELATEEGFAGLAWYHLALARASVGDFEGANAILSGEEFGPIQATSRGIQAHAQTLVQLDRAVDALELLDASLSVVSDPVLSALRDEILEDPTRSYDFIVTPQQGIAEVFYSLAIGLGSETGTALPLVYTRAGFAIDPEHIDSVLLSAELLTQDGQYELAIETFSAIPLDHPRHVEAELGRGSALFELGREDTAAEVLTALARAYPTLSTVQSSLADTLRRMERFEGAEAAYTAAIEQINVEDPRYWVLFYARGICRERLDLWDQAEADFRYALELNADQPQVLNYLGYSLVEQRRNLDEALGMIERAVAAEPRSGYIVDSLGWVLYRLGRYEEAVAPMERAVELLPNDSIVNDHLGDVYWKVGRFREARFQWERALSFEPTEEEAERVRLKLEIGLDRVLEQESDTQ
ncbi:tetratricopeptide repeat protein [Rhodophyticola sp. SM2404]